MFWGLTYVGSGLEASCMVYSAASVSVVIKVKGSMMTTQRSAIAEAETMLEVAKQTTSERLTRKRESQAKSKTLRAAQKKISDEQKRKRERWVAEKIRAWGRLKDVKSRIQVHLEQHPDALELLEAMKGRPRASIARKVEIAEKIRSGCGQLRPSELADLLECGDDGLGGIVVDIMAERYKPEFPNPSSDPDKFFFFDRDALAAWLDPQRRVVNKTGSK
jgi:hypothetical protein